SMRSVRRLHRSDGGTARAEQSGTARKWAVAALVWEHITMVRTRLPNRRPAETLALEFAGLRYVVTIGLFSDHRSGEVFVGNGKRGNAADVLVCDAGILISLLLQHGCEAETIAGAVNRNSDGTPAGVIGAVLDLVARRGLDHGA